MNVYVMCTRHDTHVHDDARMYSTHIAPEAAAAASAGAIASVLDPAQRTLLPKKAAEGCLYKSQHAECH